MTIKLAVLSIAKHTNKMLSELQDVAGNDLEVVLHIGGADAHYKAHGLARMVPKQGTKGELMEGRAYSGAARPLFFGDDFFRQRDVMIDHLHRMSDSFKYKSHPLRTMSDYQDYYHILADTIADELVQSGATHVLFFNIPHLAYDTILYQVARALGLQVIMVVQSLFPSRFFSMRNPDLYGLVPNSTKAAPYKIDPGTKPDLFYMKGIKQEKEEGGRVTPAALVELATFLILKRPTKALNPFYLWNTLSRMKKVYGSLPKWRDPYARFFHEDTFAYFDHIAGFEDQTVDLSGDFVYFPLQLQPEMTTSTLGGHFRDQAYAIERLSEILPQGVRILVKENPKQGAYMRGPLFFHRLKRIPNVTFLPSWADTHALTGAAKFAASITGTVGWEAVRMGKPALIFGRAWYRSLPGVHTFTDDLTYDQIVSSKIDHDDLEKAVGALVERAHAGVVDRNFVAIAEDFDEDTNDRKIAMTLLGLLREQIEPSFAPLSQSVRNRADDDILVSL